LHRRLRARLRSCLLLRLRLRGGNAGKQNPGQNYKTSAFHFRILLISTVMEQAELALQDIRVAMGRFDSRKSYTTAKLFIINEVKIE
jgi:hypothetical protein